ncbi:MAG: hypothetical protein RIN56_10055 [Sporomusaceae bacterium]|nr:hypothetical protein [Sporomusaceae bacterium]
MATDKKGADTKEKAGNVEKLTDEKLDKVSGGKICLICQPQHEKRTEGKVGCKPSWPPQCEPHKAAPEIHWCGPTGGCHPKQD